MWYVDKDNCNKRKRWSWLNVYMQKYFFFYWCCNADLTATKYSQPVLSLLNSKSATKHLCESQGKFSNTKKVQSFQSKLQAELKGFSVACSVDLATTKTTLKTTSKTMMITKICSNHLSSLLIVASSSSSS